jgi:catechol 2,3-dioxygenase-like lactoylglutathione lyase family enzyme
MLEFYQELGFNKFSEDIEEGSFIDQVTGIKGTKLEWVKLKSLDGNLLELLKYHYDDHSKILKNAPVNKLGCSHIAFTVKDIEQACKVILNNGGSLQNQPAISPNGNVMVSYCFDPEGVLMEIVEEIST